MGKQVFICHSSNDAKTAGKLVEQLENNGYKCWISSRDIEAGSDWAECIYNAIDASAALILLYSGNANDSWQIRNELDIATNLKIPIVPLVFEKSEISKGIKYFTNSHQWLDCTGQKTKTPEIVSALNGITNNLPEFRLPAAAPHKKPAQTWVWITGVILLLATVSILFIRKESPVTDCNLVNLVAGGTDCWNYATDIIPGADGGIIATGTWDWGFWSEFWVTAFDSSGTLLHSWSDSLSGECKPQLLATADNGCIAVFATYADMQHTGFTFKAIRFDEAGSILWESEKWIDLPGAIQPDISALRWLPDSNAVASFTVRMLAPGFQSAHFLRINASGEEAQHFLLRKNIESRCMATAQDGTIIHFGKDSTSGANAVTLLDSNGNILDLSVYGDRRTSATAVEFLADNSIIATFSVDAFGGGNGDLSVIKFSSEFELIWEKTFGGDMSDFASDIHIRNDGSIIIAGATTASASTDRDGWVLCLNSSGDLLWETTVDNGGSDYISSVNVDENGIILLTRVTTCFGNRDAWVLQMTADGNYNHTPTLGLDLFTEDWQTGFLDQSVWEMGYNRNYTPAIMTDDSTGNMSLNTNNVPVMLRESFELVPGLSFSAEITIPDINTTSGCNWVAMGTTENDLATLLQEASRGIDCELKWNYTQNMNGQREGLSAATCRVSPCTTITVPESLWLDRSETQFFTIETCTDSVKFQVNDSLLCRIPSLNTPDSLKFFLNGSSMSIPHRIDNIRIFLRRW
ncbi:MAG: toll/interleukin-1 receptor domain-containing protein [Candidatus Sabulitectum sp.]|nr:toll/interleukin-1 receptor domain-containing protein [Candidatus Sabulitectum sp.]